MGEVGGSGSVDSLAKRVFLRLSRLEPLDDLPLKLRVAAAIDRAP